MSFFRINNSSYIDDDDNESNIIEEEEEEEVEEEEEEIVEEEEDDDIFNISFDKYFWMFGIFLLLLTIIILYWRNYGCCIKSDDITNFTLSEATEKIENHLSMSQ